MPYNVMSTLGPTDVFLLYTATLAVLITDDCDDWPISTAHAKFKWDTKTDLSLSISWLFSQNVLLCQKRQWGTVIRQVLRNKHVKNTAGWTVTALLCTCCHCTWFTAHDSEVITTASESTQQHTFDAKCRTLWKYRCTSGCNLLRTPGWVYLQAWSGPGELCWLFRELSS